MSQQSPSKNTEKINDNNKLDNKLDDEMHAFYERADAFINLANDLRDKTGHAGKINASMLYATARFSAWVAAMGFVKGSDYLKEKDDIIEHFTKNFERMLSDNIEDYAKNFQQYLQIGKKPD
ncbi:hypothetical protein MOMA_08811 [Moraxella macacae 0408225]|uniref:DUF3144 domain-containing protein n=1 Tax=Moraxella macacae 0408225 TaxID=1230338 RepID=L2F862_9GAMM|nr:DUF3144 domain-containing protein [Moraxella macacae]ELA08648.1 hypothetical protein MOMA_08811 [Moraxella macacae 0408225]